ncbi:MAG: glycosyltransferase [Saccharofermentanales bacterium]
MITILCSGSRGDFQPYIALAQELQKLGKSVQIVGGKSFKTLSKVMALIFIHCQLIINPPISTLNCFRMHNRLTIP